VAELLIELFSEEIPARMQARGAEELVRLVGEALAPLRPAGVRGFAGPRRVAMVAQVADEVPGRVVDERGPRVGAPEAALLGFLRKHGAGREAVAEVGGHFVLRREEPAEAAAALIGREMPGVLRRFAWPKSMRWGEGSAFTWVRPLRRILCLLDGVVVPFGLAEGADSGHGLASGDLTEGHRFMAPGAFAVSGFAEWREGLRARRVIVEAEERRRIVADGVGGLAEAAGLSVVPDPALVEEVAGLVEWPVPLLGRIDAEFLTLPAEVMQVSMRVNQRYFALRDADGRPAPRFAFVANVEATDGGAAIIAGNERVLRARFSDARHFWDLDRRTPLGKRVPALDGVTFHAKLGSQGKRAARLERLALGLARRTGADPELAGRAGLLAKADLTTGLVGEFPELQGVMGGYYARHGGEPREVAEAIRDHYAPKGPGDPVPTAPVAVAVALADKLDQLAAFFAIGEAPSGSGDPYALRRAALGAIRLIRENGLRVPLRLEFARVADLLSMPVPYDPLVAFVAERLRVQLRSEGARHDVLAAVFAAGGDDDLVRLLAQAEALAALLRNEDGANLLTAYRRAANILRIEEKRDGPHREAPDRAALVQPEEHALDAGLDRVDAALAGLLSAEDWGRAMGLLATLRAPLDAFFDHVTVNAPEPRLRRNRLYLLNRVRMAMDQVADFSQIEG